MTWQLCLLLYCLIGFIVSTLNLRDELRSGIESGFRYNDAQGAVEFVVILFAWPITVLLFLVGKIFRALKKLVMLTM